MSTFKIAVLVLSGIGIVGNLLYKEYTCAIWAVACFSVALNLE